MAEHEHRRTEQRHVEGTTERRYGQGGRQTGGRQESRNPQQSGQTDRWSGRSSPEHSGQQSTQGFSQGRSGQRSSHQRGRQFQQTDEQLGQQTGGQMGGQQMGHQTTQASSQQSQQRRTPIQPVTVRDIAATDVVTARPDEPVTDMVHKMATEDVGSIVVVEGNRPVGIVTDRTVALALRETPDVSRMQASDLMTEDPFTIPAETNVFELARQLGGKGIRRVPVVGDQGDLQGIVSHDDVVVLLAEEFHNLSQIIRKQSPRF